jgi:hypothetical protein
MSPKSAEPNFWPAVVYLFLGGVLFRHRLDLLGGDSVRLNRRVVRNLSA